MFKKKNKPPSNILQESIFHRIALFKFRYIILMLYNAIKLFSSLEWLKQKVWHGICISIIREQNCSTDLSYPQHGKMPLRLYKLFKYQCNVAWDYSVSSLFFRLV